MRKGKMVAQGAHASISVLLKYAGRDEGTFVMSGFSEHIAAWAEGSQTKVCVSCNSEQELLELYEKAYNAGIACSIIRDEGRTEFNGIPTYTAVAIGPDLPENIDKITGHLPLL